VTITEIPRTLVLNYHEPNPKEGLMARHRRPILTLTGEQAHQAFALLVDEGKLAVGEMWKALGRRDRLIRTLRARLSELEEGAGKVGRRVLGDRASRKARKARTATRKVARRKPRISAATRKLYQQQGRYMAALRNLSLEQRARIKTIREKSGVRKAIAAAKRMR
jgi:hypothetical protein